MIDVSGAYTLGGQTYRNLASQVEQNKRDIKYLLDSGLLPDGTLDITENGEYDVKQYAAVDVDVPVGIFPTGTKIITTNGSFDVEQYANVLINVAQGNTVNFDGRCTLTINDEFERPMYLYKKTINLLTNKIEWARSEVQFTNGKAIIQIPYCKTLEDVYDNIFLWTFLRETDFSNFVGCKVLEFIYTDQPATGYRVNLGITSSTASFDIN